MAGKLLAHHGLDIGVPDLAAELLRPLPEVDRTIPGFEDFAAEGQQASSPATPPGAWCSTLSRHRTWWVDLKVPNSPTSPLQASWMRSRTWLTGSVRPLDDVVAEAGHHDIAVVALAVEHRPALDTPHQRHADLCFSRTGVARSGTLGARFVAATPEAELDTDRAPARIR